MYSKDRILDHCIPEPNSGCWLWLGAVNHAGYGRIRASLKAHRLSYQLFIGEIPEGYHVHHKCKVRCCVNPEHLEAKKPIDNMTDRIFRQSDHYSRGHLYSKENTRYNNKGRRVCRLCVMESAKERRKVMAEFGICVMCQREKVETGYRTCISCRERVSKYQALKKLDPLVKEK